MASNSSEGEINIDTDTDIDIEEDDDTYTDYDAMICNVVQPVFRPNDLTVGMFANFASITDNDLPKIVDYTPQMLGVRNQRRQGSCVAMACSAVKEWQEKNTAYFSPQFIYNNRFNMYDNDSTNDFGMYAYDMLDIMTNLGVCYESTYPYGTIEHKNQIPQAAYTEAMEFVIKSYALASTASELRKSLYVNGPAVIFVPVYNSGSRMWYRNADDRFRGGHAMCVVGYTENSFVIRNSWGRRWNDNGHTEMTFQDFNEHSWGAYGFVDYHPNATKNVARGYWYAIESRKILIIKIYIDKLVDGLPTNPNVSFMGNYAVKDDIATLGVNFITSSNNNAPVTMPSQEEVSKLQENKGDINGLLTQAGYTLDGVHGHLEAGFPANPLYMPEGSSGRKRFNFKRTEEGYVLCTIKFKMI